MDKYRVWHTEWEEFVTDYPICMNVLTGKIVKFNYGEYSGEEDIEDTKYILSKYTGLKDKNGVEIFEGDILKVFIFNGKGPRAKVIFKNGMFGIEDDMFGYGYDKGLYTLNQIISIRDAEVIGNIYEHPHLLEEE